MDELLSEDEVTKIYEDENVLIVQPLTFSANKYYGEGTPWYEEGWYGMKDFGKKMDSGGKIFYIIDKKTGEKTGIYKNQWDEVFKSEDEEMDQEDIVNLIKTYPSAKSKIRDLTSNQIFFKLRNFAKGGSSKTELLSSEDLISGIYLDEKSPKDSKVLLDFGENDEIFDTLDLSEDDRWFINAINYGDFEFMSSDQLYQDNTEGYGIFSYFNKTNEEKLKDIARFLGVTEKSGEEFDIERESSKANLYQRLYDLFPRQMDEMDYALMQEINEKATDLARNDIQQDFDKFLGDLGFKVKQSYDEIETTITNLLYLYSITGDKNSNLKNLIQKVFQGSVRKKSFGGWGTDYYEYQSGADIDGEKVNQKFEAELDDIIEKLNDDDKLSEFIELYNRITSKYKIGVHYETPKDKNISFRINKIEPDTKKIVVSLTQKGGRTVYHSFTEENFNKFLYNPEIFSIFHEK